MHRIGAHARLALEDGSCAIALVHIEIHHRGRCNLPTSQQVHQSHSHIVESAVALATVGKGVVRASGQIRSQTVLKSRLTSQKRTAYGKA